MARLSAAAARAAIAVAEVPAGGVRDQLDRLLDVVNLRTQRYTQMAAVGQALCPDDDTTVADGTAPGEPPALDGAAREIDARLVAALAHLTAVAAAVERFALAATGAREPERVAVEIVALFRSVPPV